MHSEKIFLNFNYQLLGLELLRIIIIIIIHLVVLLGTIRPQHLLSRQLCLWLSALPLTRMPTPFPPFFCYCSPPRFFRSFTACLLGSRWESVSIHRICSIQVHLFFLISLLIVEYLLVFSWKTTVNEGNKTAVHVFLDNMRKQYEVRECENNVEGKQGEVLMHLSIFYCCLETQKMLLNSF